MIMSNATTIAGLTILTVAGILGFTAGMIWYNLFADDIRRKKLFKKMKYYYSGLLRRNKNEQKYFGNSKELSLL
jgi:hypothetical protein